MSAGFFVNNGCYSEGEAIALLTSGTPVSTTSGSTTYFSRIKYEPDYGGDFYLFTYSVSSATSSLDNETWESYTPYPVMSCDPSEKYIDTVEVSTAVAAVLILTWVILYPRRVL